MPDRWPDTDRDTATSTAIDTDIDLIISVLTEGVAFVGLANISIQQNEFTFLLHTEL